ncbi:DUF4177 domain-containing protein [Runella slithyformis]|uniref:DUF4177 domain-containing protein n=1 Tax=Runella slithyformis (strain ATCC 29530 / DSM 19594 / LMG 11500 / NCIMB 11436 / LSU 4) TaxID=761193 RepID=A0A7U4E812_RUNSL|nr:DUF4177 domain-containing protein [Runella slithyformis]AEI51213.1 hypothetical protein Runsl_4903 [Runella slithyformis DSM 19594]
MPKYEYKVIEVKPGGFWGTKIEPEMIEQSLNQLALEGWELVNSIDINGSAYGQTSKVMFIFKRPSEF